MPAATGVRMADSVPGPDPAFDAPSWYSRLSGVSAASTPRPKTPCEAQEGKWECDLLNSN